MAEQEVFLKAMRVFETPEEFYEEAKLMLTDAEIRYIALAGKETLSPAQMTALIVKNGLSDDPEGMIRAMYAKAITEKIIPGFVNPVYGLFGNPVGEDFDFYKVEREVTPEENARASYRVTNFYTRLPYFAQFEPDAYAPIPKARKQALNEWDLIEYMHDYENVIRSKMDGYEEKMHQNDWLSLDEAMAVLEKNRDFIYLIPCNCKMMVYDHDKLREVCVRFYGGPNTEYDRGHGRRITLEEAKELVLKFRASGLMQCGEGYSMCNCDSQCCFPIEVSRRMGARGIFPRANWKTSFDPEKCVRCGKCTRVCNFDAVRFGWNNTISFDADRCWGCTLCASACPTGALTVAPIEHHFKNTDAEGNLTPIRAGDGSLLF